MEKELTEKEALGMTVNERLWHTGLMKDFDEALAQKDKPRLKAILDKVHISPEDIQFIFEQLLK